jgi:Domain of unknown function (DUF1707)
MALRASDADRERTVELLRAQQALGRLSVDELEERSAAALAAVHVEDLAPLTADLPVPEPPPAPPAPRSPRKRPRWPGRYSFHVRWDEPMDRHQAMDHLLDELVPPMNRYGYELVERTDDRMVFEMSWTPGWVILVCILAFPVGLLALLVRRTERVTIELRDGFRRTRLVAYGVGPLAVRRAFAQLEDD